MADPDFQPWPYLERPVYSREGPVPYEPWPYEPWPDQQSGGD